jgi:hypothetical protein
MTKGIVTSLLFCAFACVACSNQKAQPLYASSAVEAGYAERYPDELAAARGRLSESESKAQQTMAAFSTYPDELSNPNWQDVGTVVERADQAGRSAEYVTRLEDNERVARFFAEEKDDLGKKIGGAAQYAVKQKNCEVDAYGVTVAAMDRAIEKQLEERLHERNEAVRFIQDNEDTLGKQNVEKLQKQADDIAYTSYLTHVGVKQTKLRISELLDEATETKKTLGRTLEESRKIEADPARAEGQRRAAHVRSQAAEAAQQRIDSEIQQAEYVLKQVDDRIKKLETDYDVALKGLKQRVADKAGAKPQT